MLYNPYRLFRPLCKSAPTEQITDLPALGTDAKSLGDDFRHYFSHTLGRDKRCRFAHYPYKALSIVLRDRLMERWKNTRFAYEETDCKRTYYLSLEFLMGRALGNAMLNLGVEDDTQRALYEFGLDLEEIAESEPDKVGDVSTLADPSVVDHLITESKKLL